MGLHHAIKPFLKENFPDSFLSEVPSECLDVQVCDLMWILFRFNPDSNEPPKLSDLVEYLWRPIETFYDAGGHTYVACFDCSQHVPVAKLEEQTKRKRSICCEALDQKVVDVATNLLPHPWRAALRDGSARKSIIETVTLEMKRKFEILSKKHTTLVIHCHTETVRCHVNGNREIKTHRLKDPQTGEADLGVAHWVNKYKSRPVVTRVLDSDQIPILMLTAKTTSRDKPLLVWIKSSAHNNNNNNLEEETITCGISKEQRDIIDVIQLNRACEEMGCSIVDFCFFIICQKTDFVKKVTCGVAADVYMRALLLHAKNQKEELLSGVETANLSHHETMIQRSEHFLRSAIQYLPRRRVTFVSNLRMELKRALWNLLYWSLGPENKAPSCLDYGWDEQGNKTMI